MQFVTPEKLTDLIVIFLFSYKYQFMDVFSPDSFFFQNNFYKTDLICEQALLNHTSNLNQYQE